MDEYLKEFEIYWRENYQIEEQIQIWLSWLDEKRIFQQLIGCYALLLKKEWEENITRRNEIYGEIRKSIDYRASHLYIPMAYRLYLKEFQYYKSLTLVSKENKEQEAYQRGANEIIHDLIKKKNFDLALSLLLSSNFDIFSFLENFINIFMEERNVYSDEKYFAFTSIILTIIQLIDNPNFMTDKLKKFLDVLIEDEKKNLIQELIETKHPILKIKGGEALMDSIRSSNIDKEYEIRQAIDATFLKNNRPEVTSYIIISILLRSKNINELTLFVESIKKYYYPIFEFSEILKSYHEIL